MTAEASTEGKTGALLERIRPAVREQHPYLVGSPPDVQVKLNQNESPFDLPAEIKDELMEAFRQVAFNRYPAEQPDRLRRALADYTDHDLDGILIGNGSNELTYTLGMCFIEAGTPVVLPRPMFSLYEKVVGLQGGRLISVPSQADLRFDVEAICEAVRKENPALTVLTTPNNPTGQAMPLADIRRVLEASGGFVVVDEAYVEFSEEPSARQVLDAYPNLILLRTFSKAFGLAGLRIGYMMAAPVVIREIMKARLPFMVDRFAEQTALTLLEHSDLLAERVGCIKASCHELTAALQAMEQVEVVPTQANFVLFKTALEPETLMDRLAEASVLVRNMGGYPELEGYLRVNAGTPQENKAFLAALKEMLR